MSGISSIPPWRSRPRIPVRIEIEAEDPSSGEISMLLQQILQLVMAQRCLAMQETPSDGSDPMIKHRARFEIDGIGFSATMPPLLDEQDLRYLYKLTEYGVFVRDLPAFEIRAVHPMNETEARSLVHCLRLLLGFSGDKREVSQSSTGFAGVQSLTISKNTPRRYLEALLAGAQVSTSLRTIRIQIKGMRGRREMWRRIATSLFGQFATHNVVQLEVDLDDFRSVDVDAIVDELQDAKDGDHTSTTTVSTCVVATSAEFYLFEPVEDDEDDQLSSITFEPTAPVEVRALESTDDWDAKWMVQLPGWGDAWINAPDERDIRTVPNELLAGNSDDTPEFSPIYKWIPQIEILSMSTRSADAVISLLEVIGGDVQYLEVAKYSGHDPIDSWSHAAMCPSLRDFKVASATTITNVDTFCDALTTAPCRPTNVTFAPMRGIHYATISRVFERLGDATDPLASQLQGLVMQLEIYNETSLCVVHALKDMLQTNHRLLNVGFAVDVGFRYREAKARVKEILAPVVDDDTNTVMVPTGPLALHRKLAFLSAVHSREPFISTTLSSPLQRLDGVVVAIIFAFAAPSRPRTVYVQYV